MPTATQIDRCFDKPIIPVLWDISPGDIEAVAAASSVFLQGGAIAELSQVADQFTQPPLDHIRLFVHIDLVAGLENNEAGLDLLVQFGKFDGIVTIHQHLIKPAKSLGLLSVLRMFLSDSRALKRGLQIAKKVRPNVIELLPAAAAAIAKDDLDSIQIPRIAGGLCRTESDARETLSSGCRAVTSTLPTLWRLNERP